jgi:selenocysteine lyase/cysteine desulfurase
VERRSSTRKFAAYAAYPRAVGDRCVPRWSGWGHFYAKRAIEALGLAKADGIVRVSMVHYNTPAEVERLVRALDDTLG